LVLHISCFDPILQIDINGEIIKVPSKTVAKINRRYNIQDESVSQLITVVTQNGKKQKEYLINYGAKPKAGKSDFRLTTILAGANVEKLDYLDVMDKSTKTALTLVPMYNIPFDKNSSLSIMGILLREKYSDEAKQKNEISFTKLGVKWLEKNTFMGQFTSGFGMNDIRTNNKSIFIGETETMSETYFSADAKQKIGKESSSTFGLALSNKDFTAKGKTEDDETDAKAIKLKAGFNTVLIGIKSAFSMDYTINDAIGKYQDHSKTGLNIKLSYKMGDLTPSLKYSFKQKNNTEAETEPIPEDKSDQVALKVSYKLLPKLILGLEHKYKKQISNIPNNESEITTTTLSITHMF